MKTAAKIGVGFAAAAVVVGLTAMALPAFAPLGMIAETAGDILNPIESTQAAEPTPKPAADAQPDAAGPPEGYVDVGQGTSIPAGGPGDCTSSAYIHVSKANDSSPWSASLSGALVDMGPREYATGEVGYADSGRIATYTVESGDALYAIGDRFCIYNATSLSTLNGYVDLAIQPGDKLVLDPAAAAGFEFVYPFPE